MGDYFNWLHLTDLHYGQKGQGPLWSNVRQAFFKDLAALHGRCGPWHAVLFTGDLVYSGNSAEFDQLEADVLGRLYAELERLGSGDAVLLAVPGNHDLARPDIRTKIPSNLRQLLRPGGMDEIADEFWIASDTEYHQVIGKAFSNYSAWWDKTPWRRGTLIQPGRLSGDFAATLTVGDRRIGIAGLNTTFLQLVGGDYRNRLVWDPEQLRAVSGDPADWAANHDACLLLTHQAGEWLTESARNIAGPEINPAGRFAVHLFGHMHENDLSGVSKGGGQQRFDWQASSLFGMEKFGEPPGQVDRRHGYAAGRLEFGKKDITIRCWPRTASYDSNGWRLYADHEAGPLKKDEGTKPQCVGSVKRTVPTKTKGKRSPGAAAKTTERALLTTYLRAVRGLWDIVDLAGLPEDDRHLAMQKFMLRQLYMPLRMVIEETTDESLLDALEGRRERQRLASAGRTAKSRDTEGSNARLSVGAWLSDRLAIETSNGHAKPSAAPRLVVLGDPGGGKSTLLRWLATACLLRLDNSGDFALLPDAQTLPEINWIPILIRCRELDKKTLGQSFLEDLLRQTLPKLELSASYVEELISLLRDCLETGAAIILIDGLDEITDPSQRIAFCERVEVIAKYYSRVPVLITSRVVGYREMQRRIGAEFAHGTLDDLRPEEKDSFVERWCDVTITDPQRRVAEADALRRGIHSNDRVARLTGNPMLLTTMALVQRKVGKLPPKRHKLYWEAVDLLLRWRASPDDPPLDSDEALPQLEYLAYTMCDLGVQRLRRDEVLGYLAEMRRAYPDIRPVHRQTPEEFLAVLERRTGLLTEMGTVQHDGQPVPVYEFRHLTFQEYLAALSLVRGHFPGHEVGSSLAARVGPLAGRIEEVETPNLDREFVVTENWREALRLCVASCNDDDVSSVLEAILNALDEKEARPRAILAAQCLADEPNVQSAQAVRIIAAFASHIRTEDAGGNAVTSLARASMELRTGDWRAVLDVSLVREFLKRPPETRGGAGSLAGMIGLENVKELPDADTGNWLRTKTSDLLSASDEEATGAALTIMDAAWARLYGEPRATFPSSLPKNLITSLISFLHRGAAMAHAGAWALGWLAEDKEGELWQPTEAEREPLLKYLNNPSNDPEALRWVVIIAERKRFAQAGPSIAALTTAPSLDLRRAAMRALALVGDTIYFALFRQSLNAADADIRRAALHGLLQNRDEMDRRLFGGDRASTYLWHDPAVAISQGQIIDFSKRNKVSEAAARKRVEMIAQEFDLRIEPNYKRTERKRSRRIP